MKTTVVLNDDIARHARKRAAELGISFSEFTERSLCHELATPARPRERITLPTSGQGLPQRAYSVAEIKALQNG